MNCSPVRKAYVKEDWIIYIQRFAEKALQLECDYNMNPSSMLKDSVGNVMKTLRGTKQNPAGTSQRRQRMPTQV